MYNCYIEMVLLYRSVDFIVACLMIETSSLVSYIEDQTNAWSK